MNERDTKQEILDMAALLFFQDGYHVGIDRIIKESGVAKMTFYKHFPSKTDLLCAVISGSYRRIDLRVREIAADDALSPLQQAHEIFDFLCQSMADPDYLGGLITRALVELTDEEDMACHVAIFDAWQMFCAIRRACLKAGTRGAMVGRQIYMVIVGGHLLTPLFAEGPSLQAAKATIREILARHIPEFDSAPAITE